MIKIGFIQDKFIMSLEKYNYNTILRYNFILKLLKNKDYIPNFTFVKSESLLVIKEPVKILYSNDIKLQDIQNINDILSDINDEGIKINYIDNIPLLKNQKTNKLYFLNLLWASNKLTFKYGLNKDITNNFICINNDITNKYLVNQYFKKMNIDLALDKNIIIFYAIIINNYNSNLVENIYNIINKNRFRYNIRYVLVIKKICYNKLSKIFEQDQFTKFFIIKVNDNIISEKYIFTILEEVNDKTFDFLFIYNLDPNYNIKQFLNNNIEYCFKNKLENILITNNKTENILTTDIKNFVINNNNLHKTISKNNKSILNYNKNDIDYRNIIYNNTLISKETFLKIYNKININYNFIDRIFPKKINTNCILFDKLAVNNIKKKLSNLEVNKLDLSYNNILLSLIVFYDKINIIQSYSQACQD